MEINKIPDLQELEQISNSSVEDRVLPILDASKLLKTSGQRYSLGMPEINEAMAGGFKDGDLVIISGKSGSGKTTYAQTLTYFLTEKNISCLWFSYEVSLDQLNLKFQKMGIGEHYFAYTPAKNTTGKLDWIKKKIREGFIKYNTKVIFIDHIDFLTPDDIKTGDSREVALKKIAIELKSLAIEMSVVIVLMAHVRKMSDANREPEMDDVGYSAGIFQLSDYVFIVGREMIRQGRGLINDNSGDTATDNAIIKIVKNRETGKLIYFKMHYENGRFNPISEKYESDGEII